MTQANAYFFLFRRKWIFIKLNTRVPNRFQNSNLVSWCSGRSVVFLWKIHNKRPGGRLNIKMPSYQSRYSHVKDKTVSPTVLSLTLESPYLGKTVFISRRGPELARRKCHYNNVSWTTWRLKSQQLTCLLHRLFRLTTTESPRFGNVVVQYDKYV